MKTISDAFKQAVTLTGVSDSPRLDVELLLCKVLAKDRTWLFTWSDKDLSAEQLVHFSELLTRRQSGEPVAHIVGEREFWSLPLSVNASTLIPRPDTELLVETALSLSLPDEARVLDLGTGTGAIALALASEKKYWQVTGVDLSEEAVALAKSNGKKLGLDPVNFLQSDWFSSLPSGAVFDLLVSNPPYIDSDDEHLTQGDVRFEPLSALVADGNGYSDIERILSEAPGFLAEGGWLMFEHGWQQGEGVRSRMHQAGFQQVETRRDYGGNERVTLGVLMR